MSESQLRGHDLGGLVGELRQRQSLEPPAAQLGDRCLPLRVSPQLALAALALGHVHAGRHHVVRDPRGVAAEHRRPRDQPAVPVTGDEMEVELARPPGLDERLPLRLGARDLVGRQHELGDLPAAYVVGPVPGQSFARAVAGEQAAVEPEDHHHRGRGVHDTQHEVAFLGQAPDQPIDPVAQRRYENAGNEHRADGDQPARCARAEDRDDARGALSGPHRVVEEQDHRVRGAGEQELNERARAREEVPRVDVAPQIEEDERRRRAPAELDGAADQGYPERHDELPLAQREPLAEPQHERGRPVGDRDDR